MAEGLWVSSKILPAIGIMAFIVALVFDKSILFDDDEDSDIQLDDLEWERTN